MAARQVDTSLGSGAGASGRNPGLLLGPPDLTRWTIGGRPGLLMESFADGWHVVEDGGYVRGSFEHLKDSIPLAKTILNIERVPVALMLVIDGRCRELMQF